MNQLLNQAPAGFLPRVFYGISRGPETYRFIKDNVFTIDNLTGNVGDAYELLSPSETGSYIEAVATQINSNQIKITIQGDYQFNTENFTLINLRNGVAIIANLPNALVLQEASFLGLYNPQENKEKQITVLYDLESGNDNVVFASVDYNSDYVYNWVRIGGYINGLNGYSIWAVTASTIEAVLASAKDNDVLVSGETFTYEDITFNTGDVDLIVTLEPLVITNRGNIKGATGPQGATGATGAPGVNGKTPYIENDYWYIGGVNTGVKAVGTDGTNGQDGQAFQIQSGLHSVPSNVGKTGNVDYDGNTLSVLPTLPSSTVSGKGFVVYDPLTTPLEPFYDLYYANNGDNSWTIMHPFSGIKGQDGKNGYTPYIKNGSWYINGVNQGVSATGPQGAQGEGILSIENTGYTQGQGFTTTHITATLTDGTEEHFDITATDGAKGATGATGPTGATPNISVTATALGTNAAPTATRSGTNANPIITFGIPTPTPYYDWVNVSKQISTATSGTTPLDMSTHIGGYSSSGVYEVILSATGTNKSGDSGATSTMAVYTDKIGDSSNLIYIAASTAKQTSKDYYVRGSVMVPCTRYIYYKPTTFNSTSLVLIAYRRIK